MRLRSRPRGGDSASIWFGLRFATTPTRRPSRAVLLLSRRARPANAAPRRPRRAALRGARADASSLPFCRTRRFRDREPSLRPRARRARAPSAFRAAARAAPSRTPSRARLTSPARPRPRRAPRRRARRASRPPRCAARAARRRRRRRSRVARRRRIEGRRREIEFVLATGLRRAQVAHGVSLAPFGVERAGRPQRGLGLVCACALDLGRAAAICEPITSRARELVLRRAPSPSPPAVASARRPPGSEAEPARRSRLPTLAPRSGRDHGRLGAMDRGRRLGRAALAIAGSASSPARRRCSSARRGSRCAPA